MGYNPTWAAVGQDGHPPAKTALNGFLHREKALKAHHHFLVPLNCGTMMTGGHRHPEVSRVNKRPMAKTVYSFQTPF